MRNKYKNERTRCPFIAFEQKKRRFLLQMKYNL